jgi:hypothetical protein
MQGIQRVRKPEVRDEHHLPLILYDKEVELIIVDRVSKGVPPPDGIWMSRPNFFCKAEEAKATGDGSARPG